MASFKMKCSFELQAEISPQFALTVDKLIRVQIAGIWIEYQLSQINENFEFNPFLTLEWFSVIIKIITTIL